ncbi:uncharacterized protein LOC132737717 [Ruditapes philippinarum]|uniref:uncharacterized protein LOC132737717 n=1 Tax=Ruditapes philippinarum TaxID=129788 RepID=UPI00295B2A53|nr:uncharacterized protein LOC132737717 [Ruditapes philippinarum]
MDWEKKFTSIINESKANLSKVRNKYDANGSKNVTWAPKFYSTPMKRSTSLLEIPSGSPSVYNQSFPTELFTGTATTSTVMPYPSTTTLLDKIEQQNNAIDHLRGIVHRLETDRHNYKEQIRDLRNEIFQLTERAGDRRPDPGVERRIEQLRREMLGEVQLLQSQLQISSAKGSSSQLSDAQLLSMNRDVIEIKHAFRDELEGFRRDIEVMRSRIAKIELELASVLSGRRETERRQDGFDRTLNSLSLAQKKSQLPSSTVSMINTNRQLEKMQINELRCTLSALKDKIDIIEQSSSPVSSPVKTSPISKSALYTNGLPPMMKPYENGVLDDIDLSDDASSESSDFTEFEPGTAKDKKFTRQHKIDDLDSDDLDMDDLDLSDDDLSETSLNDQVPNDLT